MWHFVVCDDEESCRCEVVDRLCCILKQLQVADGTYDVTAYADLAQLQKRANEPAVLLLDIAFDNADDGVQVATQLRGRWPNMQLIFVTSMEEYIWNSFDAYAIGYVLKKEMDTQLLPAVERAVRRLLHQLPAPPAIPFKVAWKEPVTIPLADILYVQRENRHLRLYLKPDEKYPENPLTYLATVAEEIERLGKYGMCHISKSLIVNLGNVKSMQQGYMVLCTGEKIYVSTRTYHSVYLQWADMKEKEEWDMPSRSF